MSDVTRCSECAFMAWDSHREDFFCARTFDRRIVLPSQLQCSHAVPWQYHKRRDHTLAYQLDLFEKGEQQ